MNAKPNRRAVTNKVGAQDLRWPAAFCGSAVLIFVASGNSTSINLQRYDVRFGGKAKMKSGFDYAASFTSISCLA
jgi:hypothetical protein